MGVDAVSIQIVNLQIVNLQIVSIKAGGRVQRWYDGWEVWVDGIVESGGFLQGIPCARVWLGRDKEVTVCRLDQLRIVPALGGLFAEME